MLPGLAGHLVRVGPGLHPTLLAVRVLQGAGLVITHGHAPSKASPRCQSQWPPSTENLCQAPGYASRARFLNPYKPQ